MSTPLIGASVWEQELYKFVGAHLASEQEVILRYRQLAEADTSPAFRYLAGLILEDEQRHHAFMLDLMETIRLVVEGVPADMPIPDLHGLSSDRDRVLEATNAMLEIERRDARELKAFSKELEPVADTTLWRLLVDLMRGDTDKHIRILDFIRKQVR